MEEFKLLITSHSFGSCGEDVFDELKAANIQYHHIKSKTILQEEELLEIIGKYDALLVGADVVTERVIEKGKRLQFISKHGVGLDNIDLAATKKYNIPVAIAKNSNSIAVAELAVSMAQSLARNVVQNTNDVKSGEWIRRKGIELTGKTLGVVGTGAIGREVIRLFSGYGMEVLAYDPFQDDDYMKSVGGMYTSLEDIYKRADVITLHVPLMEETRNLVDGRALSMMKPTAILINTARGGLVDEHALYEALYNCRLGGAGIDAFAEEPPRKDHPLLQLENVICAPHVGAYTKEAIDKMSKFSARHVIAFKKQKEEK